MPPKPQPPSRRIALGAVLLVAGCASTPGPQAGYLASFAQAERQVVTFPAASEALPGLTLPEAYRLQHRIVRARLAGGDRVAGYKGGLMSAKSLADKGVA